MTREEATEQLTWCKRLVRKNSKADKALDMAIKALENIEHLKDRPCSVCEFRKENGCCKWDCVFEGL